MKKRAILSFLAVGALAFTLSFFPQNKAKAVSGDYENLAQWVNGKLTCPHSGTSCKRTVIQ